MPVAVSYPGVYVEEIPSGVRTITGVATSIAAFVGWAPKGLTDKAQLVLSWPDFYRQLGGLDARSKLGYAVSQFFMNGGQQAYIIRLAATDAAAGTLTLGTAPNAITVTAANQGAWANNYAITIKGQGGTSTRFRLQVVYVPPSPAPQVVVESFENLSMVNPDSQGRFVGDVLKQSSFVTATVPATATTPPTDTTAAQPLTGGADGTVLNPNDPAFETALVPGSLTGGVYLLDHVDLFNLLCVPAETSIGIVPKLEKYCRDHRAFLIADSAAAATLTTLQNGPDPSTTGDDAINAAFYFPWVEAPDPLNENRPSDYPPCGFVAGLYARTDATRGVWKAPAGTDASLTGVTGVAVDLNDKENGVLNPVAVNCIRNFNVYGTVLWGARTMRGNDQIGSEWKYVPVRRTALFIEESLFRALKWVVFEPNDEPLWAQIRLNVGAFMNNLFRQGAFQGKTPQEAYFVKCDKETTTQNDINLGIVNIVVGFAPLKPAEFVIIQIQQMAGQIAT
jgi:phage tail sheath protein FI